MCEVAKLVTFPVAMLICMIFLYTNGERNGKVCYSIDVRNNVSLLNQKLSGCAVIEGSLQIVLLDKSTEQDFANISFPELTEITHYLLVFRVKGLKKLGSLFPNLTIIRGAKLLGNAALSVYENANLEEIGLYHLTHILEGSVVVHKNYKLCYANTIDWNSILNPETYYEVIIGENKEETFDCDVENEICKISGCERNRCWSQSHCQILRMDCHPLCAGGCTEPNNPDACYTCKGVLTGDNKCVASCPPGTFEFWKRTCLSESECRNKVITVRSRGRNETLRFFPFNGLCTNECPSQYRKDEKNQTCISCKEISCRNDCVAPHNDNEPPGTYRITTISETVDLISCTHIYGSLAIVGLTGNNYVAMEKVLERNLGMIEEITGQLKIMHSHALLSLNFLRNLQYINGEHTNSSFNYGMPDELTQQTVVVKDNKNLQKLWDWNSRPPIQIRNGKIFFHFNPKLCVSEIDKLVQVAKLSPVTNLEVSRESNGDQTTCNAMPFNVTVEKTASNSVILALHIANVTATGRFMVFYKESPGTLLNESKQYESVSECSDNSWRVTNDVIPDTTNGTHYIFLPHLEPAVQYIFFVRSLYSTIGTSPIQTVTTLPAQPSVPLDLRLNSTSNSSAVINWNPPYHPHGKLKHYVIRGYYQTDRTHDLMERNYCVNKLNKETLVSKPVVLNTVSSTTKSNCPCNETSEKSHEKRCNAFEHATDFDPYKPIVGMETCDAYFYRLVEAKSQTLYGNSQPNNEYREDKADVYNTFPNKLEKGSDGFYNTFWYTVDANTTTITLQELRHFSQYIVLVSACPDRQSKIPCSRDAILTFRTEASPLADRIDERKVRIMSDNQTANITWEEPDFVNSFIHSYIISYRGKDIENAKLEDRCVTAQSLRESNNTYSLSNLPSGRYELRLRAISLYGEGPYFIDMFEIETVTTSTRASLLLTAFVIILMVVIAMCVILYYWKVQLAKNRILFASVNPRYEPVFVEDHWEVPRENLTLIKQLGRGIFGSVHEGILQPDNIKCAVKTTTSASEEDNWTFLKEATIMKEFHKAYHIVKLIGVVSKSAPMYVIMELMEQGDLKTFLLRSGSQFCDESRTLPAKMVLKMAAQIADGMAFLEAKKFVHRDLAARNCMVAADNTIKIGDFGLARDIYETDYYRKGDKATLPIRWMAPESIRDGIFTSNSDMWSYGVVLWEMTTLAQMPYHPKTNEEVIKYVQTGQVLEIPKNTHEVLRPIMSYCWKWHASQRPRFAQILRILDLYMDSEFRKVSFFHNGEDPSDPSNIPPFKSTLSEDCYIYSNENEEINLYLGQSPSVSGTASTSMSGSVKYSKLIPNRTNGHVDSTT